MQDQTSLPLSRMATINKPSFWIFILACMALYVTNKAITPDKLDNNFTDLLIIGAAFAGLLLNILTVSITNKTIIHTLTITCYIFEAVSVVVLLFLIFSR